MTILIKS